MKNKTSRAYRAGTAMAKALVEMIHLMYQENTARNFTKGFMDEFAPHHALWQKPKKG